jgi:hypothetical protein
MPTRAKIPELLHQSAAQIVLDFQLRELDIADKIKSTYKKILGDFREELTRDFYRHFYIVLNKDKEPSWDFTKAKKLGLLTAIPDKFDSQVETAERAVALEMEDELDSAFQSAFSFELWNLYQLGVDTTDADFLDPDLIDSMLIAAGISGLSYLDRLSRWTKVYQTKFRSWFKGAVSSGMNATQTQIGLLTLENNLENSVVSLGKNELRRGYLLGQQVARDQYEDEIKGEVWLAREDPVTHQLEQGVCLFCASLHLTITELQPITDSHPNCRCSKAPIPLSRQTGQPIDYAAFLQMIGRR